MTNEGAMCVVRYVWRWADREKERRVNILLSQDKRLMRSKMK